MPRWSPSFDSWLWDESTSYEYAPNSSRLKKIDPSGAVTLYLQYAEIRNWGGAGEYVLAYPFDFLRYKEGEGASILHRDQLNSVRAVSGSSGMRAKHTSYLPFGETMDYNVDPATAAETKGFIGERYDADAGLQYLNARYFDPQLALLLQPDWFEVTEAGVGTNRYAYSLNDPVNLSDPGGNFLGVIKGTFTKNSDLGYQPDSPFIRELEDTFREPAIVVQGTLENNDASRKKMAEKLFEKIKSAKEKDPKQRVVVVTHSNGRQVFSLYQQIPNAPKVDLLVTLAGPVRSDYPIDESKIGYHIQVYSQGDDVVPFAGINSDKWVNIPNRVDYSSDQNIDATYKVEGCRGACLHVAPRTNGHGDLRTREVWRSYVRPFLQLGLLK